MPNETRAVEKHATTSLRKLLVNNMDMDELNAILDRPLSNRLRCKSLNSQPLNTPLEHTHARTHHPYG